MARRKSKAKRRRGPKMMSLINIAESYAYATILTEGLMGTSPVGVITGASDIKAIQSSASRSLVSDYSTYSGTEEISLADLVASPDVAFSQINSNMMSNWQAMAIQSLTVGLTFKFGKKLLRRPVANVNRNIFKPLGMGVKL
jgi:hypothetical protein|tara:strand:- start:755 stop:1180 length:426 start_codon:yes stop_codon:yes gene_type:complete